jgi:hypothetical protein
MPEIGTTKEVIQTLPAELADALQPRLTTGETAVGFIMPSFVEASEQSRLCKETYQPFRLRQLM